MRVKEKYRHANGVGQSVFSEFSKNLSGWLTGAADLTNAIKGNPGSPDTVIYNEGTGSQNMGLILGIAGAIVVVIILVFTLKK